MFNTYLHAQDGGEGWSDDRAGVAALPPHLHPAAALPPLEHPLPLPRRDTGTRAFTLASEDFTITEQAPTLLGLYAC